MNIIKSEINDVIKSFYEKNKTVKKEIAEKFKNEVIDWADLKCYDVSFKYVAHIDGVDPECYELKEFIEQKLKEKGFDNIEIIIEQ